MTRVRTQASRTAYSAEACHPLIHYFTLAQCNTCHTASRTFTFTLRLASTDPDRLIVFKLVYLNLIIARPRASQLFTSTVCVCSARAGLTPPFRQCPFLTLWSN